MPHRHESTGSTDTSLSTIVSRKLGRLLAIITTVLVALAATSLSNSAEAATGRLIPPQEAFGIAAGLTDAASDLGMQCLMAKVGDRIRGGSPATRVASTAVKESLAFAKAQKGCNAMVETLQAAGVIVELAEFGQPAWVSLDQSTKKRFLRPDECSVVMRVGPSQTLAAKFTATFTC